MTDTTTMERSGASTAPGARLRRIEGIYGAPALHWVGDGFRVAGYFEGIQGAAKKLDPFLLLDYHPTYQYPPTEQPRGVGVHPHRGFETVTISWQGNVAHHDSTGAGGVIGPGDVQWMTAASGILHKEYHEASWAKRGGPFHMAQLWVNLPAKHEMDAPHYQPITAAQIAVVALPEGQGSVRVIAGSFQGVQGPAKTYTPVDLFDIRLNAGGKLLIPIPEQQNAALLAMKGSLRINGAEVAMNDLVIFEREGEALYLEARADAQLLLMSGVPLEEPMVQYGPFVMNTQQEIRQAFTDFNSGKFGHLED